MSNRRPTSTTRLKQDYLRLKRDPVPYITAEPLPSNILEWHYCIKGPEDTPYYGGYYHGTLVFPTEFPFKPPAIFMVTPNGRFKTNTRLCLSISDFHPDTWNPAWSVATILTGLLSFMLENTSTSGSAETTIYEKHRYAKCSLSFNMNDIRFRTLFPEICDEIRMKLQQEQEHLEKLQKKDLGSNSLSRIQSRVSSGYVESCLQTLYYNVAIFIGFAVFVIIVNYVIRNLNQE